MQFDNQKTRNVADVAARIMAGESAVEKEPKMLEEALKGNQHKIDANKNNKVDAEDFKILRGEKKMKEETELTESHFKVGDEVVCKKSGMEGEVVKVDEPQVGKYYTVKQENGKMVKYAPNELKKEEEEDDEDENKMKSEEVHNKKKDDTPSTSNSVKKPVRNSDGTIQSPISRARELAQQGLKKAMSKEETEIDEAMFPGTKEYEKKFGQSPQQKLKKKGDTVPTSQGDMTKTDKGIAHRRRFTEMLESYTEGGLKYIASLVKEEPDNEQYTKEMQDQKAKMDGKKKGGDVAKASVQAVKNEETEIQVINADIANGVEQIDELSKGTLADYAKKATHSARIKQKIAKDFEAGAQRARKPDMKAAGEELSKKYQRKAQKREEGVGKAVDRLAKEEVEQIDELKKSTLASYAKKAVKNVAGRERWQGDEEGRYDGYDEVEHKKEDDKLSNRKKNIDRAIDRLAKEEVELDEGQAGAEKFSAEIYNKAVKSKKHIEIASNVHFAKSKSIYDPHETSFRTPSGQHGYATHESEGGSPTLKNVHHDLVKNNPHIKDSKELRAVASAVHAHIKKNKLNEEVEELDEREMTDAEMNKREKIVKSMKKGLSGFKQRYGDRAKEVMYATATKQAMKD